MNTTDVDNQGRSASLVAKNAAKVLAVVTTLSLLAPLNALAQNAAAPTQSTAVSATPAPATANPAATTAPTAPGAAADETLPEEDVVAEEGAGLAGHDLSPWGMYQAADIVVKGVMITLLLASVATWTIWLAKTIELSRARRRLRRELSDLRGARSLNQAAEQATEKHSFTAVLIEDAQEELRLSNHLIREEKEGIKERVCFRLDRLVAACGREMNKGTGVLATIGSVAPFVGLFGTVWGIMNSFIGIAKSQNTNLAVVAPGIAEALLATAIGLVAAIPAVIIYNVFSRSIGTYKAEVSDASAQVLLLVSRDLDTAQLSGGDNRTGSAAMPHVLKVK
ncbi:biopolymer transport protein ExbB [Azomonas agilis]|uniref:Biopolymer transport protein ExbB n=1 Tax=Azomonas agilis TaxID=116849 RepID=A0A562IZ83_9GAMM|nr:tonB-system energizer ExbB [Azomonas agilis]TWH76206.1 biopolymer transport protein ExbB [Azomonas agilis]